MNKLFYSLLVATVISFLSTAQAPPQGINYQAVAVDENGKEIVGVDIQGQPIAERAIRVRFSVIKDNATGTLAYREEHTTNTDENGLFNLIIGTGFQEGGNTTFPQINWGTGLHFLKVELDPTGGFDYVDMGTHQFWSVPYALYTEKAGNGINDIVDNGDGTSTITMENGDTYIITSGGAQGPQGNGIASTTDNGDGTFTLTYDDGTTFTTSDLTGPQGTAGPAGPQGDPGEGITNITDNGDGTLTLTYGSGLQVITSDLSGPQGLVGPAGPAGSQGLQGAAGNDGISLNWLGTYAAVPISPSLKDAYYNSTEGISYI
jgi:hypothetical protein